MKNRSLFDTMIILIIASIANIDWVCATGPGIILSTMNIWSQWTVSAPFCGSTGIPVFPMKRRRHKEVKRLVQGHAAKSPAPRSRQCESHSATSRPLCYPATRLFSLKECAGSQARQLVLPRKVYVLFSKIQTKPTTTKNLKINSTPLTHTYILANPGLRQYPTVPHGKSISFTTILGKHIYGLKISDINVSANKNRIYTMLKIHSFKKVHNSAFHCWVIEVHLSRNSGHILTYPWSLPFSAQCHLLRKALTSHSAFYHFYFQCISLL